MNARLQAERAIDAFWKPHRPGAAEATTRAEPMHAGQPVLKGTTGEALDRAMRGIADAEAVLQALIADHADDGAGWQRLHFARLATHGCAWAIVEARSELPVNRPADPIPF